MLYCIRKMFLSSKAESPKGTSSKARYYIPRFALQSTLRWSRLLSEVVNLFYETTFPPEIGSLAAIPAKRKSPRRNGRWPEFARSHRQHSVAAPRLADRRSD